MRKTVGLLVLCALSALSSAQAVATVVPPIGLAPGSQYQLIFVTFDTTTATSSNIGDYNAFVTAEAGYGASHGLPTGATWHAVASTAAIDAKVNAPSGGLPVYNTQGQLVAASGIYAGSLLAPVRYDEFGLSYDLNNVSVWTGSDPFGVGVPGATLGGPGLKSEIGGPGDTTALWMQFTQVGLNAPLALFALSSPITFVPEPDSVTLVLVALVALGGVRFLRCWRAVA